MAKAKSFSHMFKTTAHKPVFSSNAQEESFQILLDPKMKRFAWKVGMKGIPFPSEFVRGTSSLSTSWVTQCSKQHSVSFVSFMTVYSGLPRNAWLMNIAAEICILPWEHIASCFPTRCRISLGQEGSVLLHLFYTPFSVPMHRFLTQRPTSRSKWSWERVFRCQTA